MQKVREVLTKKRQFKVNCRFLIVINSDDELYDASADIGVTNAVDLVPFHFCEDRTKLGFSADLLMLTVTEVNLLGNGGNYGNEFRNVGHCVKLDTCFHFELSSMFFNASIFYHKLQK